MCETCGCGQGDHNHTHDHHHEHPHRETINLNHDILSGNNLIAAMNRSFFEGRKVFCINMVSSPGSGKTTLLEKSIGRIPQHRKVFVVEGDQKTDIDSERIEKAGAPAIQINTGSGCHLDAKMVESAVKKLDLPMNSILFIENVGNLVCPAMYDLGENKRVIVTSVTEGDDKPLKYPFMFETSQLCIINKTDLLPHVDFSTDRFIKNARSINHHLGFISLSARTGDGMDKWIDWIMKNF